MSQTAHRFHAVRYRYNAPAGRMDPSGQHLGDGLPGRAD